MPPTPARCSRYRSRYEPRSGRFDVTFEIANERAGAPTRLRFTGTAIETVEAAVLARNVERNEMLKSSDVVVERRPKAEVGSDAASARPRGRHAGATAASRRAGAASRRSRQARSGAARPERHLDLRIDRRCTSPSAARRWTAAPKATWSTCSICNRSARCRAS